MICVLNQVSVVLVIKNRVGIIVVKNLNAMIVKYAVEMILKFAGELVVLKELVIKIRTLVVFLKMESNL